jgi:hypothetical protein
MTTEQFIQSCLEAARPDGSVRDLETDLRYAFSSPYPLPRALQPLFSNCCGSRAWGGIVHYDARGVVTGRCGKCGDGAAFEPEVD